MISARYRLSLFCWGLSLFYSTPSKNDSTASIFYSAVRIGIVPVEQNILELAKKRLNREPILLKVERKRLVVERAGAGREHGKWTVERISEGVEQRRAAVERALVRIEGK